MGVNRHSGTRLVKGRDQEPDILLPQQDLLYEIGVPGTVGTLGF